MPGIAHENYWFQRHLAAYQWVARSLPVRGAVVVEAGCGEGYGGQLLAEAGAALVAGLDLDQPSLRHAARTYPGVRPVRANLVSLPLADGCAGLVVASQVVEHLWDQDQFVRECARVLRPGGRLVVTTPNRRTFPPGNPFHSRELDAAELARLVGGHLDVDQVRGLRHGPRLARRRRAARQPRRRPGDDGAGPARRRPPGPRRRSHRDRLRPRRPRPRRLPRPRPHRRTPVSCTRRDALHRPAQPPALAAPARHLAGRRGVAAPGLVRLLPAAGRGARPAGSRRPPRPAHPRRHPRPRGGARRPVRPARAPRLARAVAAARRGARPGTRPRTARDGGARSSRRPHRR